MNRKQNNLLFILFLILLMCMNLAKALSYMVGTCNIEVSPAEETAFKKYFGDDVCKNGNCVFSWKINSLSRVTTKFTGDFELPVTRKDTGENNKVSDKNGYVWDMDIKNIKSFQFQSQPLDNRTLTFKATRYYSKTYGSHIDPKSKASRVPIYTTGYKYGDTTKWVIYAYDDNEGFQGLHSRKKGYTYMEKGFMEVECKEDVIDVLKFLSVDPKDLSHVKFTLGYDDAHKQSSSQERELLWGVEDGKFKILPDFEEKLVLPNYMVGRPDSGSYTFEFEDKYPLNKDETSKYYIRIIVSNESGSVPNTNLRANVEYIKKTKDGKKRIKTGIKPVGGGLSSIVPIRTQATVGEVKEEKKQSPTQEKAQDELSNALFIVGRTLKDINTYPKRVLAWGIEDGKFTILADHTKVIQLDKLPQGLNNGAYSFEYEDQKPINGDKNYTYFIEIKVSNKSESGPSNTNLTAGIRYFKRNKKTGLENNTGIAPLKFSAVVKPINVQMPSDDDQSTMSEVTEVPVALKAVSSKEEEVEMSTFKINEPELKQ